MDIDAQPIIGRLYGPGGLYSVQQAAEATVRPDRLPIHPVWPIVGPPTTERTGRLSQPIGWDGNLAETQATTLKKLKTKIQSDLTVAAAKEAEVTVRLVMSAAGTMSTFMYHNKKECVHVPHVIHGMECTSRTPF